MATTLVFDLGGVVLNWQPAALLLACLPDRLKSISEAQTLAAAFFESFQPGGDWAEFDRGVLSIDDVAHRIAGRTGLPRDAVLGVMQAIPAHLTLRDDTVALIHQLQAAGHRLVYLSNMPAPYTDHVQQQLDSLGAFERGIYSSDVRLVKPQAEIFALATQMFACSAADCVFLDDNLANVDAAIGVGWQALHFVDAAAAQRELTTLNLLPRAG